MATAFEQQRSSSQHAELSFEDRLGLLIDTEWTAREARKLAQRLRHAKLRYPASLEDVDFSTPRGLSRDVVLSLGTGGWIRDHHHLLITGPTGIGNLKGAHRVLGAQHGDRAGQTNALRPTRGAENDGRSRIQKLATVVFPNAKRVQADLVGMLDLLDQLS